jgi:hypothetical protein
MKTTCYLQVEPTFARWDPDKVYSITVKRVTQRNPRDPLPGCVVVKLNLNIADAAFEPLKPVVDVDIPADLTQAVTAEAEPIEVPA